MISEANYKIRSILSLFLFHFFSCNQLILKSTELNLTGNMMKNLSFLTFAMIGIWFQATILSQAVMSRQWFFSNFLLIKELFS